jgi:hypothetical protein
MIPVKIHLSCDDYKGEILDMVESKANKRVAKIENLEKKQK